MRFPLTCALMFASACSSPEFEEQLDAGPDASSAHDSHPHAELDASSDLHAPDAASALDASLLTSACAIDHGGCDPFAACIEQQNGSPACGACQPGFSDDGRGGCVPVLTNLRPAVGELDPPFDPHVTRYDLELGLEATDIAFTASASDQVDIQVEEYAVASDQPSPWMPVSILQPKDFAVRLAASNGLHQAYAVNVTRAPKIQTRLAPDSLAQFDDFGGAVAIDGDTLAIGSNGNSSDGSGIGGEDNHNGDQSSGAVYVYRKVQGAYQLEAFIKAHYPTGFDRFGVAIALEGDLLAVGAPGENSCASEVGGDELDEACNDAGAVYVFRRTGGTWTQEAYLKASNAAAIDEFGLSVDISGDRVAVGARGEDSAIGGVDAEGAERDDSQPEAGAAYIFAKSQTGWTQEAYLKPHAPLGSYRFGTTVDLDGETLAVGAPGDDGMGVPGASEPIADSGAIYVFERSAGAWHETAQLRAVNPGASDELGIALVLRYDLIVAGAWGEDSSPEFLGADENVDDAGAIYVFRRTGDTFAPLGVSIAKPRGVQRFAAFGSVVTLCDPRTMFVGSQATDLDAKGAGSTGYLMSTEPPFEVLTIVESRDPELEARFAGAADCQPDALFVGAWNEDDRGAAYVIR